MPKKIAIQRRYWIGIVTFALAVLLLISYVPTWAAPVPAPHNQTVPIPTPKPDPTKVPTATPHSDNSDNNRDDDRNGSGNDGGNDGGSGDAQAPLPDSNGTPEPGTPEGAPAVDTGFAGGDLTVLPSDPLLTGEVVVVRLNVRSGPGTAFDVVGALSSGDSVQLLARNEAGTWWAICCVGEAGVPGWASAQFIKPVGSRTETSNALTIVGDLDDLAALIAARAAAADAAASAAAEDSEALPAVAVEKQAATDLALEIIQVPLYAAQGDPVELHFTVTNIGKEDAINVLMRDQLPDGFTYTSATADGDGTVGQSEPGDAVLLRIGWPQLGVGETASAVVSVKIDSDLPPGSVLDNLVAVDADNASSVTAGLSIGMAPVALPDF